MKIDVLASEPHYLAHMIPIWCELPASLQGTVHPPYDIPISKPPFGRIAMVAGWQDVRPLRGRCNMIYVEHGAGQTYTDRPYDPSYSGSAGDRHDGVMGYICPSDVVAARWKRAPSVAVGCPKMDRYIGAVKPFDMEGEPVVCFAWHWDCTLVPETRSVWPHYEHHFGRIVEQFRSQGFRVVGHEHPKWRGRMAETLMSFGVEILATDDEVFKTAHILIVDNSSLAYEFASLGKPVLLLNAPWYRRDVQHGLRFWSHPPGLEFDEPQELLDFNLWNCFYDTPERELGEHLRIDASNYAYKFVDGQSAKRAADWITDLVSRV